ncbi:hypothetical protein HY408_00540 [Candidatus Gottesmanbacteria bacterium]|nr:hypothetical protein [Candidatus Gottesmanbacteria bacterium]
MQKKAHLNLRLIPGDVPLVKKGDVVKKGDRVVEATHREIDEFNIAKLLGVSAQKAWNYLKPKETDKISKNDILAIKKGLLKTVSIRSPVDGKFIIVDRDKAVVGIERIDTGEEVTAWFDALVLDVTEEKIVFEVTGTLIVAKDGKGHPVSGRLRIVTGVTMFTLPTDLESTILALKEARSDIIAKADTLGVLAIVAESFEKSPFSLPFLLIETLESMKSYEDKNVIVYGDKKQLLVIDTI